MGKLTPLQVKKAKPGRLADGDGLYLLVKESGAKSWVLRVQYAGRRRDFGPGPLTLVRLAEAREKAREWRKLAKDGIDPTAEAKRRRALPTFEEAARQYHETVKSGWRNPKHRAQWLSTLETYAFPSIGGTRVDQIDAPEIQSLLLSIWRTKPETARRVRQRVATVLNFSKAQGWRHSEAPIHAVNTLLNGVKQPKGKNFAAMPHQEVRAFLAKLRDEHAGIGRLALQFLILTAARSGEVRGATWAEIDFDAAQWNIPAERMKVGEAHSVPLSKAALEVLQNVCPPSDRMPESFLFPGLRRKPLSDMTLTKALRTAGASDFTVHGFRSAFRDWVAEATSYPGDWAEAALAHKVPNRTEAAYRRTKYLQQRRKLMDAWSHYVASPAA